MPASVSIEMTRRCPLQCQHCYNNLPMADAKARAEEMTFEEHVKLLDELVQAGCMWVLYTGGEIFARKDFLDIYTEAKKRGFFVTLFTNGTMITERIANYLAEWRPFAVEITLYGATRETYEALTQIPGSYDRCMRGIRLLLERGLPLKLKTVPTTINYHEVYEMKRMAEEDFGVEFKFDPLINPRIDCSQAPLGVRLTPEQAVTLDFADPKRANEWSRVATREAASPLREDLIGKRYVCGGGSQSCAIDPAGEITICVISHQQGISVRDGGFVQGWNGGLLEIRNQKRTRPSICDRCRIRSLCNMCAANGELESGDPDSPVNFLCEVAHLRAFVLGIDPPKHGDCSRCKGGSQYGELQEAAERIRNQEVPVAELVTAPRNSALPILQSSGGCQSGGCGACAAQH